MLSFFLSKATTKDSNASKLLLYYSVKWWLGVELMKQFGILFES